MRNWIPFSMEVATIVYAWLPMIGAPLLIVVLVIAATALLAASAVVIWLNTDDAVALNVVVITPRSLKAAPVQPRFSDEYVFPSPPSTRHYHCGGIEEDREEEEVTFMDAHRVGINKFW